jgi:hypothetical protein
MDFEVSEMTQLAGVERLLPDGARLAVTRAASVPWLRQEGNLH